MCANTQPEPGVALNPPVPQPQLKYSPRTGVFEMIGQASGHTSTIPPHCRSMRTRLNTGNNSMIACIVCSMVWKLPRWPYPLYASMPAPMTSSPLSDWLMYP